MDSTVLAALFGALATVAVAICNMISNNKRVKSEDIEHMKAGLCALLRITIIESHEKHTANGFCTITNKEEMKKTYDAYHRLGGNDIATALYNEVMALKVTDEGGKEDEN